MKTAVLTPAEREFLSLISRAAFANPFSEERERLDLQISGLPAGQPRGERVDAVVARLGVCLEKLDASGRNSIRLFGGEDRHIVENAFLFDIYHEFIDDFDRLIPEQIAAGDAACQAGFAQQVFQRMAVRGFSSAEAGRFFGMFYQLRRAFYFIDRALIGQSPSMRQLRLSLWNNVFTSDIRWYERYLWNRMEDFSTLLLGETGTGKGAAAAAIGRSGFIPFDERKGRFSESFMRSFISVNLSQFPESLVESELFGHRKGAFTGAIEHHEGVLARCRPHGAIFIDEIGDVSPPVQIKLLQVLQDRTFSPVGSHDKLLFRGRVIAATNKPLDRLRREGQFREDFFYRLCSDIITVPPLRERLRADPGEMDLLLGHLVKRLTGQDSAGLAAEARAALSRMPGPDYPWPGNVRELEQAVRRILLTGRYEGSQPAETDSASGIHDGIEAGTLDAEALLAAYAALLHRKHGTYEEVARRLDLDRRTVKKYVMAGRSGTRE